MKNNKPWLKRYDKGVPENIDSPDVLIHHFVEKHAKENPGKICTIFQGAKLTYKQIDELSERLAAGLSSEGVKKGDIVAVLMVNSPQFLISLMALFKLGAAASCINILYCDKEIVHQLNDSKSKFLIVMSNYYERIKAIQHETPVKKIVVTNIKEYLPRHLSFLFALFKEKKKGFRVRLKDPSDIWMRSLIKRGSEFKRPMVAPDDVALLQYTGGTTGSSKGAVVTHKSVVMNLRSLNHWADLTESDAILIPIPLFHIYGLVIALTATVKPIPIILIPDPREIGNMLNQIHKHKASIMVMVPKLCTLISNYHGVSKSKLGSLRMCISGASSLASDTRDRFEKLTGCKIMEGFGMTEALITHCNPFQNEARLSSIGLPLPSIDCKIVSLKDKKTVMDPGKPGELLIKGDQIMKGYLNRPDETAKTIKDGWMHTGDVCYMDKEGYFFLIEREKNLIKPSGFQVWPKEIEDVINSHPSVLEAAVVGAKIEKKGKVIKAWVVLKPEASVSEEDIIALCRKNLARYKIPKVVEFTDSLPKTSLGKLQKFKLESEH